MSDTNKENIDASPAGDKSPDKSPGLAGWKVIAPLASALMVYFAYLVGVAFHETYLDSFAVSPGVFPKGRADYLVYAVSALLRDLIAVASFLAKSGTLLRIVGIFLVVGIASWGFVEGMAALSRRIKGQKRFSAGPQVKSLVVYLVAFPLAGAYLTFAVPTAFATIMVIPVELGVSAAKAVAADDTADFKKGCAAHSHGKRCFTLREGKETVAMGFIIEQSKDTIAMWDNGVVQVLPLEKRALVSVDSLL